MLAGIADLELVARIVVDGLVSGLHRSPFHGYSAEFSQYRHYRQGDDLKYVDWKLVARTDRLYTKQFRETTNMAAMIVVDTSASMAFAGMAGAGLAASASARVEVSLRRHRRGRARAPDCGPGRRRRAAGAASVSSRRGPGGTTCAACWRRYRRSSAQGTWAGADDVRRAAERLKRRGLLLVLSDFYDDEDRTLAELRRAHRMGHEVVLFQILTRDEIELPYRRDVEFTDLETGRRLAINAGLARRDYKDAMAAFLEQWRSRAAAEGFQYSLIVTDTPPQRALRNFLLARR